MKERIEKDHSGNIRLNPVVGWTPFVGYHMACCLRIEYATSPEHLRQIFETDQAPDGVQIVLTAEQAEALARDLSEIAKLARQRPDDQGH